MEMYQLLQLGKVGAAEGRAPEVTGEGGEGAGDGNAGNTGVTGGQGAVFGVLDDEAVLLGQFECLLGGEEEGGIRLDGVAVRAAEHGAEAGVDVQPLQPALHPAAGG